MDDQTETYQRDRSQEVKSNHVKSCDSPLVRPFLLCMLRFFSITHLQQTAGNAPHLATKRFKEPELKLDAIHLTMSDYWTV
jgi:hypothetical protein